MILGQYDHSMEDLPKDRRYDATLTVCVLQTLLTNCQELLDQMSADVKLAFGFQQELGAAPLWGLTKAMVDVDEYHEGLALHRVLRHLRNALSHPVPEKRDVNAPPSTGYTSPASPSKRVTAFTFTASRFVTSGGIDHARWCSLTHANEMGAKLTAIHGAAAVVVRPEVAGRHCLYVKGVHHLPVFTMTVDVAALRILARNVAEHLAQPLRAGWAGAFEHLDAA